MATPVPSVAANIAATKIQVSARSDRGARSRRLRGMRQLRNR
jgi:hypothetical protein